MPTRLTIPERQQFGVGLFEQRHAFDGLAALRWSWPTAFTPTWQEFDLGLGPLIGGGGTVTTGGVVLPDNFFSLTGQQALTNITKGMTRTQHAPASEYVQRAFVLAGIGAAVERVAADVLETKKDGARRTKPRAIIRIIKPNVKAQLAPLAKRTAKAEAKANAADKRASVLEKRVASLERRVHHAEGVAIPGIEDALGGLREGLRGIRDRFKHLNKWLGLAAFLALLIKALEKMGGSYIRCSNTKRWGRNICGMNPGLLETLLADTLLVAATIDLVTFARANQSLVSVAAHPIRAFWQADQF